MAQLLFFLGATYELAQAELEAVFRRLKIETEIIPVYGSIVLADVELDQAETLQSILGGTFKIAEIWQTLPAPIDDAVLQEALVTRLVAEKPKAFTIAEHGRDHLPVIDPTVIKRELDGYGVRSRYKDAPRTGASAALLRRRHTTELHVIQTAEMTILAQTRTVQNVDAWSERDMEKPARDRKRGMLAPKLAHMMVNLALDASDPAENVVLDPFCGTGTILIEATVLGVPSVAGADIDAKAIIQSESNLKWWRERSGLVFKHELVNKQVSDLQPHDLRTAPTHIVTEPFLGKLTPTPEQVPGVIRGLEKLYRGTLRHLAAMLPSGGRLVILFPSFRIGKKTLTVSHTLNTMAEFGFTQVGDAYPISRQDSITQRSVYVLEYKAYGTR